MKYDQLSHPDWLVGFELHEFRCSDVSATLGLGGPEPWEASVVTHSLWRVCDAENGRILVTSLDFRYWNEVYPKIDVQRAASEKLVGRKVMKMTLNSFSHDLTLHFDQNLDLQLLSIYSRCEMWNIAVGDRRFIGKVDQLIVVPPRD